ncbi:hypothetical protein [Terracoccus luteus]|uniref:Uncharacterized protein n=1 Tax=Terracoccus luteus TaxID=53356 RepID=A0A495XY96_9MICO|nr:hypothetical protein [Terracoccus luteus]MBB2985278.1 hypothetical protein [Terracoccus luteus]MCP2170930.1 hypothetical protein [Terracoccus luteus]RKT77463.1 hypothetical protein DFJ68_0886 [Terracoccus luteus]
MTDNQPVAPDADTERAGRHTAGAFDIRNFIGGLLGIYGVILTLMGLFGDQELEKTGGMNANLWAGLALLVVSVVFIGWARLRPTIVPANVDPADDDPTRPGPARHGGH